MIFYDIKSEDQIVQAMRIPPLFAIDERVRFDMWATTVRLQCVWSGAGFRFKQPNSPVIPSGYWIVWTGVENWEFRAIRNAEFVKTYQAP